VDSKRNRRGNSPTCLAAYHVHANSLCLQHSDSKLSKFPSQIQNRWLKVIDDRRDHPLKFLSRTLTSKFSALLRSKKLICTLTKNANRVFGVFRSRRSKLLSVYCVSIIISIRHEFGSLASSGDFKFRANFCHGVSVKAISHPAGIPRLIDR